MRPHITHLILSGGGLCGILYTGIFRFLEVEKIGENIRHVSGTSIGSFFATMFVLGITSEEIEKRLKESLNPDFLNFKFPDIFSIFDKYGIENGDRIIDIVKDDLGNVTFQELSKRTGKDLVICATRVKTMCPVYFSADTTPNVCVIDALRASIALPWFIRPVKIGDEYYVDGGVSSHIPYEPYINIDPKVILLVAIETNVCVYNTEDPIKSPIGFTLACLSKFMSYRFDLGYKYIKTYYPYSFIIHDSPIPFIPITYHEGTLKINLTIDDIDKALCHGYEKVHEIFYNILNTEPNDPPPFILPQQ